MKELRRQQLCGVERGAALGWHFITTGVAGAGAGGGSCFRRLFVLACVCAHASQVPPPPLRPPPEQQTLSDSYQNTSKKLIVLM